MAGLKATGQEWMYGRVEGNGNGFAVMAGTGECFIGMAGTGECFMGMAGTGECFMGMAGTTGREGIYNRFHDKG